MTSIYSCLFYFGDIAGEVIGCVGPDQMVEVLERQADSVDYALKFRGELDPVGQSRKRGWEGWWVSACVGGGEANDACGGDCRVCLDEFRTNLCPN